jgi:hypothetical protein
MNNWKIVSQIATGFGIVFVGFALLAAWTNYELVPFQYGSGVPDRFVQLNFLASMLVYLMFAALSFTVAWITWRSVRISEEMSPMTPEPQEETQTEETEP